MVNLSVHTKQAPYLLIKTTQYKTKGRVTRLLMRVKARRRVLMINACRRAGAQARKARIVDG